MNTSSNGSRVKSVSPEVTASPSSRVKLNVSAVWLLLRVADGSLSRRATSTLIVEAASRRPPARTITSSTVRFLRKGNTVSGALTAPLTLIV